MAEELDNVLLELTDIFGSVRRIFIARVSKGRTAPQFVVGVLLVPKMVTFLRFSVLGRFHGLEVEEPLEREPTNFSAE